MKQLNIERGFKGGWFCFFEHNGSEYYADLSMTFDAGEECMIFHAKGRQVTNWGDLYCNRTMEYSPDGLKACIEEFIAELDQGE